MLLTRILLFLILTSLTNECFSQFKVDTFRFDQALNIPRKSIASIYPATISVSNMPDHLSYIGVRFINFRGFGSHVLLVSPEGRQIMLFSDIGDIASQFTFRDLLIDSDGNKPLTDQYYSNYDSYQPTNFSLNEKIPIDSILIDSLPSVLPTFHSFQDIKTNGEWKLFIYNNGDIISNSLERWELILEAKDQPVCKYQKEDLLISNNYHDFLTVDFPDYNGETWDILLSKEDTVSYDSPPSYNDLNDSTIDITGIEYDETYYVYYRVDCSANNSNISRWVGPIKFDSGPGICANAEDIDLCEIVNYKSGYLTEFFSPCAFGGHKRMYNFTPPESGDYYLSSLKTVSNALINYVAIKSSPETIEYCDSLNWRCQELLIDNNDFILKNLSSDSVYKVMVIAESSLIDFQIGQCPALRNVELENYERHPNDVVFELIQNDEPLIGTFDLYYNLSGSNPPNINSTPTLENVYTENGKVATLPRTLLEDTDYSLYIRYSCSSGTSCWIGPFSFKTDPICYVHTGDINKRTALSVTFKMSRSLSGNYEFAIRDTMFTRPDYHDMQDYNISIKYDFDNEFLFYTLYNLRANSRYYYYIRAKCRDLKEISQEWQGPFVFDTNNEMFLDAEEMYCGQCAILSTTNPSYDLFPVEDGVGCPFDLGNQERNVERLLKYKATKSGKVELRPMSSSICPFGGEIYCNFFLAPQTGSLDIENWEFIGCRGKDGFTTIGSNGTNFHDTIEINVIKDSVYYILADIAGTICGFNTPAITFNIEGDCVKSCPSVSNLRMETLQDGNTKVTWSPEADATSYNLRFDQSYFGEYLNEECYDGKEAFTSDTSYVFNLDSVRNENKPNKPVSLYVISVCPTDNRSYVSEIVLTPELAGESILGRIPLNLCFPTYNRQGQFASNNVFYNVFTFSTHTAGKYFIEILNSSTNNYAAIYENDFNPNSPQDNLLEEGFGDSNIEFRKVAFEIELEKEKEYFLVYGPDISTSKRLLYTITSYGLDTLVSKGNLFDGVVNGPSGDIIQLTGDFHTSNKYCLDKEGWRHYSYVNPSNIEEESLMLSIEEYEELKPDTRVNTVYVHGFPGASHITNPPAQYVDSIGGLYVMNRYWRAGLSYFAPSRPIGIRTYFTQSDVDSINVAMGTDTFGLEDLSFSKVNNNPNIGIAGAYDVNPANGHPDIPKAEHCAAYGSWEYFYGTEVDTSHWALGNYRDGYFAEILIHGFSGGGGGYSSRINLNDDDRDGYNQYQDCNDMNSSVNPGELEIPYDGEDNDCNILTLDDDLDQDGFFLLEDCDDLNPDINPDAIEIENNGIDENCDGDDFITSTIEYVSSIVSLYPNPTSGKIYFSAETESMEVEVYNIFGHILDTKLIRGKDNIDLTTFENGAYFLKIRVNGIRIIRKVIKY